MARDHTPPFNVLDLCRRLTLCASYIGVSSALIRFNKFLVHDGRFPYSMALTSIHMSSSFVCLAALYHCRPGLFPGMANTEGKRFLVLKWFVPIGIAFATSLYCSNQAYMYCSVTFLQFMKEGNVAIVFFLSCAAGLERMQSLRLIIIGWVIGGASLAVSGEIYFVFIGFFVQLISQVAESARAVMGQIVLGGGGLKLDPLSYNLFVSPTCLVVLLLGTASTWDPEIPGALAQWWPYLIPNTALAFTLNLLVAALIKEVSAVGFMLAGICKDITLVLLSWSFAHEAVARMQFIGFGIALAGVFAWSYVKTVPDSPMVRSVEDLLGVKRDPKEIDERSALKPGPEFANETFPSPGTRPSPRSPLSSPRTPRPSSQGPSRV